MTDASIGLRHHTLLPSGLPIRTLCLAFTIDSIAVLENHISRCIPVGQGGGVVWAHLGLNSLASPHPKSGPVAPVKAREACWHVMGQEEPTVVGRQKPPTSLPLAPFKRFGFAVVRSGAIFIFSWCKCLVPPQNRCSDLHILPESCAPLQSIRWLSSEAEGAVHAVPPLLEPRRASCGQQRRRPIPRLRVRGARALEQVQRLVSVLAH